jgi:hypothetical protein
MTGRQAHRRQRGDVAALLIGLIAILVAACALVTGPVS